MYPATLGKPTQARPRASGSVGDPPSTLLRLCLKRSSMDPDVRSRRRHPKVKRLPRWESDAWEPEPSGVIHCNAIEELTKFGPHDIFNPKAIEMLEPVCGHSCGASSEAFTKHCGGCHPDRHNNLAASMTRIVEGSGPEGAPVTPGDGASSRSSACAPSASCNKAANCWRTRGPRADSVLKILAARKSGAKCAS